MSNDFNPYAAPSTTGGIGPTVPTNAGNIVPTVVDAGSVINYAWEVWKANLGLLVGVTAVVLGINLGFSFIQGLVGEIFNRQGMEGLGAIFSLLIALLSFLLQTFLGIGQVRIVLKLLRGQQAQFADLFGGGALFLPVLGATVLASIVGGIGFALCIVPGILLLLFFWPFYFLIVDQKSRVFDSFGVARMIAQPNAGTSVILFFASFGIMLVGILALCVGVLFAAPLVSLIWGAGYLMMSGQLTQQRQY